MPEKRELTSKEAARALNVSPATLYAYVSRGLIRSEAGPAGRRGRRYRREDVERLRARQEQRRNPDRAAEQALNWGVPILESALTHIADGRLVYRGQAALELAEHSTFEAVAELLWRGAETAPPLRLAEAIQAGSGAFDGWRPWVAMMAAATRGETTAGETTPRETTAGETTPVEVFQAVLPLAASRDAAAYDLRPHAVALTGGRILGLLAAAAIYPTAPAAGRIAERLAQGWGLKGERSARLLEAALILCADHELNTSAFTARCVASVRGTPYHVVIAALAALQGLRHGGYSQRVEALFDEAGTPAHAPGAVANWLKRGEALPGFGHVLYPDGDPRARALLNMVAAQPRSRDLALARSIAQEAERLTGERPTIDFALVVVARALKLPRGGALALFALGRTAGWIAHALEQYQTDAMIRPRARYVGE